MSFDFIIPGIPVGQSVSSGRGGEKVTFRTSNFLSSEDGDELIQCLEEFAKFFINLFSKIPIKPSQIDNLLIIVRKDKTAGPYAGKAYAYVNELKVTGSFIPKRDVVAGEALTADDIADIGEVRFMGVDIPPDAGIVHVFSIGWRKGLFYDFTPLHLNNEEPRNANIGLELGKCYSYLAFQDRINISEAAMTNLFKQGWFPFIGLTEKLIRELIQYASQGWSVDDLLPKLNKDVKKSCEKWKTSWEQHTCLKCHIELLCTAIDRFQASDYRSAVSILYTRIEGIMRDYHRTTRPQTIPKQDKLVETVISTNVHRELLLPQKFKTYLNDIYFCDFDPNAPQGASRHTVAHGVAPQDAFSEKATLIGLLMVDQLSYFLPK